MFDAAALCWRPATFSLPDIAPHPLLLVPKEWVHWRLLMDYDPFFNHHATRTVQEERTEYLPDNKVDRPSKKDLRAEFSDRKALNTDQASNYMANGIDLVAIYRREVDEAFAPMTDLEIDDRL